MRPAGEREGFDDDGNPVGEMGVVATLPSHHTHRVIDLFSHLACIPHYAGSPEVAVRHYPRAAHVLEQLWGTGLLSGCTVGTSTRYSTHAYTYAAAVLEAATGKSSADLVREEIAGPLGLKLRAQYGEPIPVEDGERATQYDINYQPVPMEDNSWKVLGGGMESTAVDLVRFGWAVLQGEVVSPASRDTLLWSSVAPGATFGVGWRLRSSRLGAVAEHDGAERRNGARTYLGVYRDAGVVVAIMANRKQEHSDVTLRALADELVRSVNKH